MPISADSVLSGPSPTCRIQGGDQRADEIGPEGLFEPAPHRQQRVAAELRQPADAARPQGAAQQLQRRAAARLLSQQAEDEIGVALDLFHRPAIGVAVAGCQRIEGGDVFGARLAELQRASVGQHHRGRHRRRHHAQAGAFEVGPQQRIMRRRHQQRIGHREQVVPEAGDGDFAGTDAAARDRFAFEYADRPFRPWRVARRRPAN